MNILKNIIPANQYHDSQLKEAQEWRSHILMSHKMLQWTADDKKKKKIYHTNTSSLIRKINSVKKCTSNRETKEAAIIAKTSPALNVGLPH